MKEMEGKVKIIMKELEIEANFSLKVAFKKYQNKQVQNKDRKRQQLVTEFTSQVTQHYLHKQHLTHNDFEAVLAANATLRD